MGATYETRELKTPNPENGEYRAYHFKGYAGSGSSRVWTSEPTHRSRRVVIGKAPT